MKINCHVPAGCILIDINFLLSGTMTVKVFSALFAGLFALSACSSTTPPPYVAVPLADLAAGTALLAHGKGMTWTENTTPQGFSINGDKPRLQKFDVLGGNLYVALFKNYDTQVSYGTAEFAMPASMETVEGVTDLGFYFTIQRNNESLIYTLSGVYTISLHAYTYTDGRFAGGGFATGSSTGGAALPTTGAADYVGKFLGQSTFDGTVTGTASLHVDFSAPSSQITGQITGLQTEGLSATTYAFTDMNIQATFLPDAAYEGVIITNIIGSSTYETNAAFVYNTQGKIAGGFYGPNADEFGAAIRITDGNGHILSGAISGSLD